MTPRSPWVWVPALAIVASLAQADFFGDLDTTAPPSRVQANSPITWMGWVQHKTAYGYRTPAPGVNRTQPDLTRFETQLYGQLGWRQGDWSARFAGSLAHDWLPDLQEADLWQGNAFNQEQKDARRWQWQWADSYLGWQSGDAWLKAGYQTLAWGEAESLIVTDVLARRDQRWPGQQDLEDTRLPIPAITLNWAGQLDLVVLRWADTDRLASAYDDFDTLAALRATGAEINQRKAENPYSVAMRWQHSGSGYDLSLMAADVNTYQLSLEAVTLGNQGPEAFTFRPDRRQVIGAGAQWVRGAWLLRTEQAVHHGERLATPNPIEPWAETTQWRNMVGVEYSGFRQLTLTLELGSQYLLDSAEPVAADDWQLSQSARARYTTWNDRLALTTQLIGLPGNEGLVSRLAADWQVSDPLSVGLQWVDYQTWETDQALHPFRNQDAVVLNLRYGFY